MKLGDYDESGRLAPNKKGVDVFLKGIPKLESTDNGLSITWTFIQAGETPAEAPIKIFDIFNMKEDLKPRAKEANIQKALSLFLAFMSKDAQDKFKKIDFKGFEEFHKTGVDYMGEDALKVPAKIMVGYDKKGYLTFPMFGSIISTELRPRNLVFDPKLISMTIKDNGKGDRPDSDSDEDEDADDL